MATKIKKTYCTMFKRTEGEKRQAAMAAELEETKRELSEVKEILGKLMEEREEKALASSKKSTRKKSTKSEE